MVLGGLGALSDLATSNVLNTYAERLLRRTSGPMDCSLGPTQLLCTWRDLLKALCHGHVATEANDIWRSGTMISLDVPIALQQVLGFERTVPVPVTPLPCLSPCTRCSKPSPCFPVTWSSLPRNAAWGPRPRASSDTSWLCDVR